MEEINFMNDLSDEYERIYIDKLFEFCYRAIDQNLIFEKTSIKNYIGSKRILDKNTSLKKVSVPKVLVKVKLRNKFYLIFEDYPLNFLLSYGIILSDRPNLSKGILKEQMFEDVEKQDKYIFPTYLREQLTDIIDMTTVESFDFKTIGKYELEFEFSQPEFIKDLKQYIEIEKGFKTSKFIKFSNIESSIENFVPTIKRTHFKIAESKEIPIIPLIDNEFIKGSVINVFDFNKILNIISPILSFEKQELIKVEKETFKRVYNDVSTTYFLKIDKDLLKRKIETCKKVNFNKSLIYKSLESLDHVELTQKSGDLPFIIWKTHRDQDYIKIKNLKHFNEITGTGFKYDNNKLKEVYIQDKGAEKGLYKEQFIKKRFEKTFKTLPDENKIVVFRKPNDLAIKSIMCDDFEMLLKYENVSNKQIKKLINTIETLLERIIQLTISNNLKPEKNKAETFSEIYFQSLANDLNYDFEKFLDFPSKTKILHKTNYNLKILGNYLNEYDIKQRGLFFLLLIVIKSLRILKIFNLADFERLKVRYKEFYNFKESDLNKIIKRDSIENKLVKDIHLSNKLSFKHKVLLVEKKKFSKILLDKKVRISNKEPIFEELLSPNVLKLRELFPFKHNEIIKQLRGINDKIKNGEQISLKIGNQKISFKEDFCKRSKVYSSYSRVCENDYFILLKKK